MGDLYLFTWCTGPVYDGFYACVVAESVEEARRLLAENPQLPNFNLLESKSHPNKNDPHTWLDDINQNEPLRFGPIRKGLTVELQYGTG